MAAMTRRALEEEFDAVGEEGHACEAEMEDCVGGMSSLAGDNRTQVNMGAAPPTDTCSCSDVAPDAKYTCAQQASWGKCGEAWMKGFCCRSCFACQAGCS